MALEFRLAGPPVPAARPRFRTFKSKTGVPITSTYYAGAYKKFKDEAPARVAEILGLDEPLSGPLKLIVEVSVQKPRTSKLDHPSPDIDNYLKAIMDAMTQAGVWHDDKQVVRVEAEKRFCVNAEEAGFAVGVYGVD